MAERTLVMSQRSKKPTCFRLQPHRVPAMVILVGRNSSERLILEILSNNLLFLGLARRFNDAYQPQAVCNFDWVSHHL
jgi:hypothetical protein